MVNLQPKQLSDIVNVSQIEEVKNQFLFCKMLSNLLFPLAFREPFWQYICVEASYFRLFVMSKYRACEQNLKYSTLNFLYCDLFRVFYADVMLDSFLADCSTSSLSRTGGNGVGVGATWGTCPSPQPLQQCLPIQKEHDMYYKHLTPKSFNLPSSLRQGGHVIM